MRHGGNAASTRREQTADPVPAHELCAASLKFGSRLAREQLFDGTLWRKILIQDPIDRGADRHVDAERAGKRKCRARRGDAFSDVPKLAQDRVERPAFGE